MRPDDTVAPFSIRLFGPFEAYVRGQPLPRLTFRKSQAVLALLALRSPASGYPREVDRGWLIGLLWPESDGSQGLRNSLTDLRRALGPEAGRLLSPGPRTVALNLTDTFVDVLAFDAALARRDYDPLRGYPALEEAFCLYRGPLLEGWAEEWVFQERQAREQAYLAAREAMAAHARALGDAATAERHLRGALAVDPLREQTQRALMELLAASGNYAAALVAYRELRLRLHRETNAEPDPETRALFERIRAEARQKAGAGGRARGTGRCKERQPRRTPPDQSNGRPGHVVGLGPALESPAILPPDLKSLLPLAELRSETRPKLPPHHLPLQLTSFIGRQTEIAEIRQQLAACRLVTLTGPGGCGKTRLAFEVAAGLAPGYPDGVWCVELAPLADPALVPQSVAAALRIREQPGRPIIETLVEALKPKELLLLLDNCEHLVEACAHLSETLLRSCPRLRILATSREPLGIGGELICRVPSLSIPGVQAFGRSGVQEGTKPGLPLPEPEHLNARTPEHLLRYEAIRLFVERAVTAQPAFSLTHENAATVAQLCCRLDGIPLALELAAARLKALPVETLGERLRDMFALLTGGSRTALPRHRTLRALIDWSYDLLTMAEQTLLRRLSVFAGGCTLAAAEAVCGDNVLDLITRLVEKSLVIYEERGGEGRYRLLEMIREYAREQLVGSGEADDLRQQHARFFLALAETAETELGQADQLLWLNRLVQELDNLRAALAWSVEGGEVELGLRLGSALERFWQTRGHVREGRTQLLRLLAAPGAAAPTTVCARALSTAGLLTWLQDDVEHARVLLEESLALWRRLEDPAGIAAVLLHLGWLEYTRWEFASALRRAEECLAIDRELGEPHKLADALELMAKLRGEAGDPQARGLLEEGVAIWRALGDRISATRGLARLADWALCANDLDTARRTYDEVLAAAAELGDRPRVGWALFGLGKVAQVQEDYPTARAFYEQSLPLWQELDEKEGAILTRIYLGHTLMRQGEAAAAYERFAEIIPIARERNSSICVAEALAFLGWAAGALGRWEETAARCVESLATCPAEVAGHHIAIEYGLFGLAQVALVRGNPTRAARLLGAIEAMWDEPVFPARRRELDQVATAIRACMDASEFEAAWTEGHALPLDQAITLALQEASAGRPQEPVAGTEIEPVLSEAMAGLEGLSAEQAGQWKRAAWFLLLLVHHRREERELVARVLEQAKQSKFPEREEVAAMGLTVAEQIKAEAAEQTLRSALETALAARFGALPAEVAAVLRSASLDTVNHWSRNAATAATLDEVGIMPGDAPA